MGLFSNLFLSIVHLLLVALDMAVFFLLVQLIYWRWPRAWLLPWNQVGRSLTESLTRPFQAIRVGQHEIFRPPLLWIFCLVVVILLRWILTLPLR